MKKNARKVFLFTLALLTVISMGSVSGTYAKYTSSIDMTDSARVAKWGVTIDGKGSHATDTTVKLFSSSYLVPNPSTKPSKTGAKDKTIAATEKSNVKSANGDNVIAPGTTGTYTFTINMKKAPETNYTLNVNMSDIIDGFASDLYKPIRYWVDDRMDADGNDTSVTTLAALKKQIEDKFNIKNKVYAAGEMPDKSVLGKHTINWEWAFASQSDDPKAVDKQNSQDTTLGNDAASKNVSLKQDETLNQLKKLQFKVVVDATQSQKAAN